MTEKDESTPEKKENNIQFLSQRGKNSSFDEQIINLQAVSSLNLEFFE